MKIGDFSKKHKTTIDTIRHYMELDLITPFKKGSHYYFTEDCSQDLEKVRKLKNLDFTLEEIRKIFQYKRTCRMSTKRELDYLLNIYTNKKEDVIKEIKRLNNILIKIDLEIDNSVTLLDNEDTRIGVNIKYLDMLECGMCGGELELSTKEIVRNQVMNGFLQCSCGKKYTINDGIIIAEDEIIEYKNLKDDLEYFEGVDNSYLRLMSKLNKWLRSKVPFDKLKGNLLDVGIGRGYGYTNINDLIKNINLYTAVDFNLVYLKQCKKIIEKHDNLCDFLFISCNFLNLPLKNHTQNIVFDIFGSTNGSAMLSEFPLISIESKLAKNYSLIGTYGYVKRFNNNSPIPPESRFLYNINNHDQYFNDLNISIHSKLEFGYVENGGKGEDYLNEDDIMFSYGLFGEKNIG
ncbi:MerR family transcriptional regulator [Vallitalea pronyensis]|uniref:MerR family transcriptional regulator n=1 Tax=Vallitalea pronyensis TaxID=1348613 RepID=A0A8J8MP64_9FIRM|nr:MerR family transcriptional regulator [Vallitalea pronyensis]QUI25365.1 MerR family transcriptional regulator [Vallitalea pronyensis]